MYVLLFAIGLLIIGFGLRWFSLALLRFRTRRLKDSRLRFERRLEDFKTTINEAWREYEEEVNNIRSKK